MADEPIASSEGAVQSSPATAPSPTAPATPPPAPVAAATIPPEVVSRLQKELSETMRAEAGKVIEAQNQRILSAMGVQTGKPSAEDNAKFLERFIEDPTGVLATVATHAFSESKKDRELSAAEERKAHAAEAKAQQEARTAAMKVLKDRPDVTENPDSFAILDTFFSQTSENSPMEERLIAALKKHDLFLEKSGAGKTEDRVKRVSASLPSSNLRAATGGTSNKSYAEQVQESNKDYQNQVVERYKKKHGGRFPASTR